jgi:hypothetical protein
VFVNFIQQPNPGTPTGKAVDPNAPDAQPGALNFGQRAAFGLTTFNQVGFLFWDQFVAASLQTPLRPLNSTPPTFH